MSFRLELDLSGLKPRRVETWDITNCPLSRRSRAAKQGGSHVFQSCTIQHAVSRTVEGDNSSENKPVSYGV